MQTKKLLYAGIGSRKTPGKILRQMQEIGKSFAQEGWLLRSGNCTGADQAFAKGANSVDTKIVEIYLPWTGYEAASIACGNKIYLPIRQAYEVAMKHHPAWHECSRAAQSLHARNAQIILGDKLDEPVDLLICWTPHGKAIGGTAMGVRIAQAYGIEVRNLAVEILDKKEKQAEFCW